jgi:hypothetical protein
MHEAVIREERYDDEGLPTPSLRREYGKRVLKTSLMLLFIYSSLKRLPRMMSKKPSDHQRS